LILEELEILKQLPDERGDRAEEEIQLLYDNYFFPECDELSKQGIPELSLIGYRMFNIWFEIPGTYPRYEFSFYRLYETKRVYPDELRRLVVSFKLLAKIAEHEQLNRLIKFFDYLIEHDLMVFPA
jgi:hypothetical protein